MAVTRIKNNQITDLAVNAASKLQDFSITSSKIANNLTYSSDFTVAGNLTVSGNVTAIDTVDLVVEDPLILLARDQTGSPMLDIGYIGKRGDEDNIAFFWDESTQRFSAAFTTSEITNTTVSINGYASMQVLDMTARDANITGNIIFDGVIDGNLAVTGNVTGSNLNANNAVTAVTVSASGNLEGNNAVITNDVSTTTVTASGNITGANVNANNTVSATTVTASGNLNGNNAVITNDLSTTTVSASGNITGDNLIANNDVTTATVTASGNISGNNVVSNNDVTTATVTASGNITGDNLISNNDVTTATVTASGNITGDNLISNNDVTTATVTASGNISGNNVVSNNDVTTATVTASGNITGDNLIANNDVTTATVTASGNISGNNVVSNNDVTTATVTASGNISGNNVVSNNDVTTATVTASGNITGDNLIANNDVTTATVTASGNITGDNLISNNDVTTATVTASGNITGDNLIANNDVTTATVTATGNVTAGNISTTGTAQVGSLEVDNDAVVSGNLVVQGNLTYINVDDLRVEDPVIQLGAGPNGASLTVNDGMDRGTKMSYYSTGNDQQQAAFLGWDNSTGNMVSATNVTVANNVVTVQDFGTLEGGKLYFANANITGTATIADLETSSLSASGNITGNNVISNNDVTTATVTASGNITGDNLISNNDVTTATVTASGNITGNNVISNNDVTTATVTASGNITGDNLISNNDVTTATVTASGNITGDNLISNNDVTTATVTASGNITGDNLISNNDVTTATVTASGNITGDNLISNNDVTTATVTASGNITGDNLISNNDVTTATVTASGNITGDNLISNNDVTTATVTASGNITGENVTANANIDGVTITASGNLEGNNAVITNDVDANNFTATGTVTTPNLTSTAGLSVTTGDNGNIVLDPNGTGVIILADETADRMLFTGADKEIKTDSNATFDGANLVITGSAQVDDVIIDGNDITSNTSELTINGAGDDVNLRVAGDSVANLLIVDAGSDTVLINTGSPTTGATLKIGGSDSVLVPVGDTASRPETPATGMVRFNTTLDALEFYDSESWTIAGAEFTVVVADAFTGDGSTVTFTLSEDSTTASTIVTINGVVQIPVTAYSVAGNVLTFTEAPESTDVIDARILTTTTEVIGITNGAGTARVDTPEGSNVEITGNLIPTADETFTLGAPGAAWSELHVAGNTIFLGNLQLKEIDATTFGVFTSDGTTTADLDVGNIDVAALSQGNSTIGISGQGGNAFVTVGGVANVLVVTSTGTDVTGALAVTGNVTSGNVSGTTGAFTNIGGTLTTAAQPNVTSVGTLTSLAVTGNVTTGNVSGTTGAFTNIGGTLTTAAQTNITSVGTLSSLTATGNITGGNIVTTGNVSAGNLIVTGIEAVTTLNVSGDTTIVGNLTVSGTTFTANVESLVVSDPVLGLGSGPNGDPLVSNDGLDRGIKMFYFTSAEQTAFMGFDNSEGKMLSAANVSIANNVVTVNSLGTTVVGTLETAEIVKTGTDGVGNIGQSDNGFDTVFAKATSAQYADLAEMYEADQLIEPGIVVCFGGANEVEICDIDACTRVAGVVSTNPSYLMNSAQTGEHVVAVALTGRVPCRVTGRVRKGDMMVSAGDGRARAEADPRIGTVIGKALADFNGGDGVIEVVVGRL
jgi:hypothetical protein